MKNKKGILTLIGISIFIVVVVSVAALFFFTARQDFFPEENGFFPIELSSSNPCSLRGRDNADTKYINQIPFGIPSVDRDSCSQRGNDQINAISKNSIDFYQYRLVKVQEQPTQIRDIFKDGAFVERINKNDFTWTDGKVVLGKSGGFFVIKSVNLADITINTDFFLEGDVNVIEVEITSEVNDNVEILAWVKERRSGMLRDVSKSSVSFERGAKSIYRFELPSDLFPASYDFFVVPVSNTFVYTLDCEECSFASGVAPRKYGKQHLQLAPMEQRLFLINPKPVRIIVNVGDTCKEGYSFHLGQSETLCLLDDLSGISCLAEPSLCPLGFGCGSGGLCEQEIFDNVGCQIDDDCDGDATCEATTGICWKIDIREKIETLSCNDNPTLCGSIGGTCEEASGVCVRSESSEVELGREKSELSTSTILIIVGGSLLAIALTVLGIMVWMASRKGK